MSGREPPAEPDQATRRRAMVSTLAVLSGMLVVAWLAVGLATGQLLELAIGLPYVCGAALALVVLQLSRDGQLPGGNALTSNTRRRLRVLGIVAYAIGASGVILKAVDVAAADVAFVLGALVGGSLCVMAALSMIGSLR